MMNVCHALSLLRASRAEGQRARHTVSTSNASRATLTSSVSACFICVPVKTRTSLLKILNIQILMPFLGMEISSALTLNIMQ